MTSESTKPPIGSKNEAMIPLDERARIEAIEEYRFEVRSRFEEKGSKSVERSYFWLEKLIAPAVIVLLTVVLSGYGIPKVLERSDRTRRANQLTADLLQEIAQQTAEMQASIEARSEAIESYWADASRTNALLGEFALKRDVGEMTLDEFNRQDNLIENDRKRISTALDTSADDYARQLRTFRPWLQRTRTRINFLYPEDSNRAATEQALIQIGTDLPKADAWLKQVHDRYEELLLKEITAVKQDRQRFKRGELGADDYRERVNGVLDRLRDPVTLELPAYALDGPAIARTLDFIKTSRPSV